MKHIATITTRPVMAQSSTTTDHFLLDWFNFILDAIITGIQAVNLKRGN